VRTKSILKIGLTVGLMSMAFPLLAATEASADYAPQPGDIVGVGGDTAQFGLDFGANGDYSGDAGFNAAGAYNRLVTFSATADANGRAAYLNGSTEANPLPLDPTVVLRAGTYPVQRISSSGAALSALLADTGSPEEINFIWSSSLPTPAQQSQASTNAPAGLSINELLDIYTGSITKWNQLPGNSGGSGDTIIPMLPPSTSSVYKTFLADLKTANGNVTPTLSAAVQTVEQNDPTAITGASSPADAIVPFSLARLNLWNDGYFHNPTTVFPGGSVLSPGVKMLTGTPGDGNAVYSSPITDYVIFRQSDASSSTPMEPGGTRNWVETLFANSSGPTPYFASLEGQALIAAAGITPDYANLGDAES
jgi:hypothetical protein